MKNYIIYCPQHNGLLDDRKQRFHTSLIAALRALRSVFASGRVFKVVDEDGIYCYQSLAALRTDDDGSCADAVIEVDES